VRFFICARFVLRVRNHNRFAKRVDL
jgi:hypothetical protein